jgi:hypothetical protein
MKLLPFALLLATWAAGADTHQQLKQVQSVYILPMASGMDQYLANKITRQGLFLVVTDPRLADAILTDRIGEPFERKIEELYPAPPKAEKEAVEGKDPYKGDDKSDKGQKPEKAEKPEKVEKPEKAEKKESESKAGADTGPTFDHPSSFGRGKGTIFLVDRKSRAVIWSTYDRPNNMRADTLDKTADQVVNRIKHDLNSKETK